MNKLLYTLAALFVSNIVIAQTTTENYVQNTTPKVPVQTKAALDALSSDDKQETITYYDGLGRPKQSISKQVGGNKEDIITPILYDGFGRQIKEYLPKTRNVSSLEYEIQNETFFTNLNAQYQSKYPNDLDINLPNPFSEKVFEASPLNRVLEQAAPGEDWSINNHHTIKFDYQTNTATEVKNYQVQFLNGNTETPELYLDCSNEYYDANTLYKNIIKDENWTATQTNINDHTTVEFKDKLGKVLLKRNYNSEAEGSIEHDTYYVYDDFNNLTYVIPPKASDIINGGTGAKIAIAYQEFVPWTEIALVDKELAEEYQIKLKDLKVTTTKEQKLDQKYGGQGGLNITIDSDNELTVALDVNFVIPTPLKNGLIIELKSKKEIKDQELGMLQGDGYEYLLFIQKNGLYIKGEGTIMTANQIFYTSPPPTNCATSQTILNNLCYQYKYDYRNRLIEKKIPGKGWENIVYNKLDQPILTQDANLAQTNDWLFTKYDAFGRVVCTGKYNDINNRSSIQNTLNNVTSPILYESKSANDYTNNAFPTVNLTHYTTNFYDNYSFNTDGINSSNYSYTTSNPITTRTKGLVTGSKVRVLETSNWITTVTYYDEKARPVYVESHNDYLQSVDIVQNNLDAFTGILNQGTTIHTLNGNTITTVDNYTYDHVNRLLTQTQSINGATAELIVNNTYDELGQLISKKVGGTVAQIPEQSLGLQTINYDYNIRGWLKEINNDEIVDNDLFNFKLNYNKPLHAGVTPLYNGNISETHWETASDNNLRSYDYNYDALNRIKAANYHGNYIVASTLNEIEDYSLHNISYDKNGNITTLERAGLKLNTTVNGLNDIDIIDDLSYTYLSNSNQLTSVSDTASKDGFKDANTVDDDYSYDINGNMITDKNKKITSITYNHLNLPTRIVVGNDLVPDYIEYVYDATGVKLEKRYTYNKVLTPKTFYAGNYIYRGNFLNSATLQFMSHPEGYTEPNATGNFAYVYQYKDHLGNIRLSYKDVSTTNIPVLEIQEENNYYPFGLKHKGYNNVITSTNIAQNYKYNGKELQSELGLDWYDYGARNYDAALGRWMNIDPHSDSYFSVSPYNSFANNPISFIDPTGKDIIFWQYQSDSDGGGEWKKVGFDQLDKVAQKALGNFAKTKSGKALLGAFANKGDKIGDVEFSKDGKYANHNFNFQEFASYGAALGTTPEPINNNMTVAGPLKEGESRSFGNIDFYMQFNTSVDNDKDLNYAETIGHEAFIHLIQYLDDYVEAFEANGAFGANAIYVNYEAGNPEGSKDHIAQYNKSAKAQKYYQFINQLKSVFNPKEVQRHVNNERRKSYYHANLILNKK